MAFSVIFFVLATVTLTSCCPPAVDTNVNSGNAHIFINRVPYMAILRQELQTASLHCSAVIVNEQYVITAANCIEDDASYELVVGTESVNDQSGEIYEIEKIRYSPYYNEITYDYNVALIKLAKPLTFGPKVNKIQLPEPEFELTEATALNVTGWYKELENDIPTLTESVVQSMYNNKCHDICYPNGIDFTSRMLCAESFDHKPTNSDSGSALTRDGVLVGITSIGQGCGEAAGLYTKISSVVCWIDDSIVSDK